MIRFGNGLISPNTRGTTLRKRPPEALPHRAPIKWRRAPLPILIVIVVLALTACGTSAPTALPPSPDAGCTAERPVRIQPVTAVPSEMPYLTQIVACANAATGDTTLTNRSQLVWAFSPFDPPISAMVQGNEVRAFHASAAEFGPSLPAFMVPGETVGLGPNASSFEWAIHPALSSAWLAFGAILGKVKAYGPERLRTAFAAGSKTRAAIWTCTAAVFKAGDLTTKIAAFDPMEQINAGLGVTSSAGVCATSWKAAERQAGRANFPSWADDIATIGKISSTTSGLVDNANFLQKAVYALVKNICQVLNRFC